MSRYSGKCDLADHIEIYGGFQKFMENNPEIYVGDSETKLSFAKESELMPYYPYVISVSAHSPGHDFIRLMSISWVDYEEQKYGHMTMHDYYRNSLAEDIEKKKQEETESENNLHIG